MMRVGGLVALLREWAQRLVGTVFRRRSDADLAREIAFHVEQAEIDLRRRGYNAQEARRLARALSGSSVGAIDALRAQAGVPWFGAFTLDVKLGARMLRKYWGLSLVGGLALAVVIGICTATFLYFNVFWSTALPIDGGDRVVAIQAWDTAMHRRGEIALDDFERWRTGMASLEDVGAFRTVERNLAVDGRAAERVAVAEMSAAGFRVARTAPVLGRSLVADDERPGAAPVVVLGYGEWQRRFDGDPNVLGRAPRLDDSFHTIVGVMPRGFAFPLNHRLWIPLRGDAEGTVSAPPLGGVFARLASGVELETAQAELAALGVLPDNVRTQAAPPPRLLALPYAQNFIDDIEPDQYGGQASMQRIVILLMSLLLVPPGLNIAMLVYAFTVNERRREIGVRVALGAPRARLLGGVLKPALRQILAAAALGVAVALFIDTTLPAEASGGIDIPGVLPVVASFMVLVALLSTLEPALRALRLDPNEALRDDA